MLLAIAIAVFILVFGLLHLIDQRSRKAKTLAYIDVMYKTENILDSLYKARDLFPRKSIEYLTISGSINYLQFSIMRDYETAFKMIEKCFKRKEVKKLHEDILESEKQRVILLLAS